MPVLAGPRSVADLPGGLTNRNLRVTTRTGDYVVRLTQSDAGLLGIDRDAEHANTRAAAEAGRRRARRRLPARPRDAGHHLPAGQVADQRDHRRLPACIARAADADPPAAGRAALRQRLRHVRPPGGLPRPGARARVRPATTGTTTSRRSGSAYAARSQAQPAATVPCHNDLLAGNFIDDGQHVWLIDYEYSGNNDPAFELGNTSTECDLTTEQTDELVDAWSRGRADARFRARVELQALCSEYGWSLWGFIQSATSPMDFDFHGWGMERFEKAVRRFTSDGFDALLDRVGRRWLRCEAR